MLNAQGRWCGYADAKPSETIQRHDLPGLAVAVAFPHKPGEEMLQLPVKQYKDYRPRQKVARAGQLAEWLIAQKELGLVLTGFINAHTQVAAATLGLELIEELPNTSVERHYDSYRLHFDGEYIDFPQAVALEYYFSTISFGILRAGRRIPRKHRKLFLAMDRFPGAGTDDAEPGKRISPTQGAKFIEFVQTRSKTGRGMLEDNKSLNLEYKFGTINWWRRKDEDTWRRGKTHPHFVLPDWLAVAAIVHEFRDDFVATFTKERIGIQSADALDELYKVFKSFDLWSWDRNVLAYLRAEEKLWKVPNDARDFILGRAESSE